MRINESLDFDTVLQGALDSARSLTGARFGVMTLLDDRGRVQDFLSSGMTGEEAERMWKILEGLAIFERLGSISEPFRLPELEGYVRSLGFTGFILPSTSRTLCWQQVGVMYSYSRWSQTGVLLP